MLSTSILVNGGWGANRIKLKPAGWGGGELDPQDFQQLRGEDEGWSRSRLLRELPSPAASQPIAPINTWMVKCINQWQIQNFIRFTGRGNRGLEILTMYVDTWKGREWPEQSDDSEVSLTKVDATKTQDICSSDSDFCEQTESDRSFVGEKSDVSSLQK